MCVSLVASLVTFHATLRHLSDIHPTLRPIALSAHKQVAPYAGWPQTTVYSGCVDLVSLEC